MPPLRRPAPKLRDHARATPRAGRWRFPRSPAAKTRPRDLRDPALESRRAPPAGRRAWARPPRLLRVCSRSVATVSLLVLCLTIQGQQVLLCPCGGTVTRVSAVTLATRSVSGGRPLRSVRSVPGGRGGGARRGVARLSSRSSPGRRSPPPTSGRWEGLRRTRALPESPEEPGARGWAVLCSAMAGGVASLQLRGFCGP
eukprot:COSAG06_NODE_184_length_20841_cov_324.128483_4_plen_199_part_00